MTYPERAKKLFELASKLFISSPNNAAYEALSSAMKAYQAWIAHTDRDPYATIADSKTLLANAQHSVILVLNRRKGRFASYDWLFDAFP
jgi:hypothetical protein